MLINEINFNELEAVKKRCLAFAKDGNTIVKPYKTLYGLEQITHKPEHSNLYIEVTEGTDVWSSARYYLVEDFDTVCYAISNISGKLSIEQLITGISNYKYIGKSGQLERLSEQEKSGEYINNLDIALCIHLGERELARHYTEYRQNYIAEMDAEEEAARKAQEQEDREEEEKLRAEMERTVAEAEKTIREHGTLMNKEFNGGTIVLHLLKKYGIKVPIKTQGWVNKALAKIWYRDGEINYSYYSTSRNSNVFYDYLVELERKICEAA